MKRKKIKIARTELFVYKGKLNDNRGTTDTFPDPTTTMVTTTATGFAR